MLSKNFESEFKEKMSGTGTLFTSLSKCIPYKDYYFGVGYVLTIVYKVKRNKDSII